MRIVLPDTLTAADLDAAIEVLSEAEIAVTACAFVMQDGQSTGSIVLVDDAYHEKALSTLMLANYRVAR